VAGPIANRIFYLYLGASLSDFKGETAFIVLFVMALVFGPFLVFAAPLASAKRTGPPIVPLFLTMMSLEDLVRKLLGLVF
jgi:hypothetical protein